MEASYESLESTELNEPFADWLLSGRDDDLDAIDCELVVGNFGLHCDADGTVCT